MILDAKISLYTSCRDRVGRIVTMRDFINLCGASRAATEQVRAERDKEKRSQLKQQLPCATISGAFSQRQTSCLLQHSGYICADIDHVEDTAAVIDLLWGLDIVAYVSRSVSGAGVFAIIPIAYPEQHAAQYRALQSYFATLGIELDKACKDITRLRCVSWDADARLRTTAVPYRGLQQQERPAPTQPLPAFNSGDYVMQDVDTCCRMIVAQRLDITAGYDDWVNIGMALASLGEAGRAYFHCVSQFHPKYKHIESDRKFDNLLATGRRISIKTFFKYCANHGIYSKNA